MNLFGEIEELAGRLYPYRWPISIAFMIAVAGALLVAYRRGWHRVIRRHARLSLAVTIGALAVLIPLGNYTLAPLWSRTELNEVSPLLAPAADAAAPALGSSDTAFQTMVRFSGDFFGADQFHFGAGQAHLIETAPGRFTLRFENFSVRNGPDLFVYLSPSADGYADGALNLGVLKATDGAFNYEVPAGTDVAAFKSVIVWCKRFTVLFATAPLAAVG